MSIQRPSRYFSVVLELRMWITYGGKNFLKSAAKRGHSFRFISFCTKLNSTLFDTILDHATIKLTNEARIISEGRFSDRDGSRGHCLEYMLEKWFIDKVICQS